MKCLIIFILIHSFLAHAWEQEARALLPKELQQLSVNNTSQDEAVKILGKPNVIEGENYYWIREDFKYAIALTFKDSKLIRLHYNFPMKPSSSSLNLTNKDYKEAERSGTIIKLQSSTTEVSLKLTQNEIQSVVVK